MRRVLRVSVTLARRVLLVFRAMPGRPDQRVRRVQMDFKVTRDLRVPDKPERLVLLEMMARSVRLDQRVLEFKVRLVRPAREFKVRQVLKGKPERRA